MITIERRSTLTWITPSEVIEYLFCPRFIYFMNCLLIPQNEDQRYKVLMGRNIHKIKTRINKDYLRKKLNVKNKNTDVYLGSDKYGIRGIVDEVLELSDGTFAPLDYKYAQFKNKIFTTYKYQSLMYALLIKENYNCEVNRGYICYIRSKNHIEEIEYKTEDFNKLFKIINDIFSIIETSSYPKSTKYKSKCIDCCYRNICVK